MHNKCPTCDKLEPMTHLVRYGGHCQYCERELLKEVPKAVTAHFTGKNRHNKRFERIKLKGLSTKQVIIRRITRLNENLVRIGVILYEYDLTNNKFKYVKHLSKGEY